MQLTLEELLKKHQAATQKATETQGAITQIMDTLRSEFKCNTFQDAVQLLKNQRLRLAKDEARLAELLESLDRTISKHLK